MNSYLSFFRTLSAIVGAPVVIGGAVILADRLVATVQCEVSRVRCERSFTQGVDYLAEQVTEDHDVVLTPAPKRKR